MMAEPTNIRIFLSTLVATDEYHFFDKHTIHTVPSSTLIFEVVEDDTTGDLIVGVLWNDSPVQIPFCSGTTVCTID